MYDYQLKIRLRFKPYFNRLFLVTKISRICLESDKELSDRILDKKAVSSKGKETQQFIRHNPFEHWGETTPNIAKYSSGLTTN